MQKTDNRLCILVVDDDVGLRELIRDYLNANGFAVAEAMDGQTLREALAQYAIALVILDLMLPGEDGLTLLRELREHHGPPVIIVSARGDEVDRVVGLELGADDYLPKPFGPRELLARVRAVLRRSSEQESSHNEQILAFGPFRLHLVGHVLSHDGVEVPLTFGEFNLLRILLEHANQVVSRDQLIGLLKGYERSPFDRSIDVRVTRLRRKIEPNPESPVYLRTVWGEGYLFTPQGEKLR
jgi:DNA-binding response OmpR family regulator